jgi:hypothetical protein
VAAGSCSRDRGALVVDAPFTLHRHPAWAGLCRFSRLPLDAPCSARSVPLRPALRWGSCGGSIAHVNPSIAGVLGHGPGLPPIRRR